MTEPIEDAYFNWLCVKVNKVEVPTPSLTYFRLFRKLHSTEFVWLVPGDDNRCEDGVELRDDFLTESGFRDDPHWHSMACSIFEMLIAFSRRAEFNAGETPEFWFWLMLENLGISFAADSAYNERKVDRILYNFVWRLYDFNGEGGLFPLENPTEDQRQVEIWYQFNEWLDDTEWPV